MTRCAGRDDDADAAPRRENDGVKCDASDAREGDARSRAREHGEGQERTPMAMRARDDAVPIEAEDAERGGRG